MKNLWQHIRVVLPVAVVVLLLSLPCPVACANNNGTAATTQNSTTVAPADDNGTKAAAKPKTKPVAAKIRDKSVMDADVLDSPLSYFKEAFTPEEEKDSNDAVPALVNTVKALVATLLSTVM